MSSIDVSLCSDISILPDHELCCCAWLYPKRISVNEILVLYHTFFDLL